MKLIFATRPSALARWQTRWVIKALKNIHHDLQCEEKIITTQGDKILDRPLPEIGGKGLFTQELENELLSGAVHCAVHSLKDLPVENPAGLTIGCIPARAEVRDALISASGDTLSTLPANASVGTSSLRRSAQVLSLRPELRTESLRGNVDTRLRKLGEGGYDALVLASAGLERLGRGSEGVPIPEASLIPAAGQGCLALEARTGDARAADAAAAITDQTALTTLTAERAVVVALDASCHTPVGAHAELDGQLRLTAFVGMPDGSHWIRDELDADATDPAAAGREIAERLLAAGAAELLAAIGSAGFPPG